MGEQEIIAEHLAEIRARSKEATLMEICGGHTNVILKYGLRALLSPKVRLISGPGCPVCVSPIHDIDAIIQIARSGIPIASYGDLMRVPGSGSSLDRESAAGAKIFEVISTEDVITLSRTYPNIVFFGAGFETTAPMTAYILKKGICVYSVHKMIPPALRAICEGEVPIDGFINPGHVSTIIGTTPFQDIPKPQAVAGFTPEQILRAIRYLLRQIEQGKNGVINAYPEAVKKKGNPLARGIISEMFTEIDSEWRGLGMIPYSGLEVRDNRLNAKILYADMIAKVAPSAETDCRCGEILTGKSEPENCPLYAGSCTPEHPIGACMVSREGTCAIAYSYSRQQHKKRMQ